MEEEDDIVISDQFAGWPTDLPSPDADIMPNTLASVFGASPLTHSTEDQVVLMDLIHSLERDRIQNEDLDRSKYLPEENDDKNYQHGVDGAIDGKNIKYYVQI